jgi:hypothetical protein
VLWAPSVPIMGETVSGGVNMYWNRRDKSRRGELAEWQASSRFYLIFHTIARAFDDQVSA